MYEEGFGLNTTFIIYLVQLPKSFFGGTYLDYFLLFQAVGFFGLVVLMRTFEEIYLESGTSPPPYIFLLLFMPSLHYWTSAIGKDSLFFFGICLTLWAAMNFRRRIIALSVGMLLMLAIRPHIAVIAAAAFTVAVLIDRNTRLAIKIPVFVAGIAGTIFAVFTVWSTFSIDLTDIDAYSDVLAGREALTSTEDAGRTAVNAAYPVRVVSLLFRPLFLDANGLLGVIVSLENLLLVVIMITMLAKFRTLRQLTRGVAFVRYAVVCSVVVTAVLALGYYNVGLGIRQKATMILPQILVAFVALRALQGARLAAVAADPFRPAPVAGGT
jgi:hypothetical protein